MEGNCFVVLFMVLKFMKTPVIVIHGGNSYPSHEAYLENLREKEVDFERMRSYVGWKMKLQDKLGDKFDVFSPRMPMGDNADYELWKLWFEKILNKLNKPAILLGHSLGAMFLVKYYSENKSKNKVKALLLVAPVCCNKGLSQEGCAKFELTKDVSVLTDIADNVVFFHSEDDPVVSYKSFLEFKKLIHDAEFMSFSNKGHFNTSEFPEIIKVIKALGS